MIYLYLRFR